nr:putative capsid [Marmot picobirnavirus]
MTGSVNNTIIVAPIHAAAEEVSLMASNFKNSRNRRSSVKPDREAVGQGLASSDTGNVEAPRKSRGGRITESKGGFDPAEWMISSENIAQGVASLSFNTAVGNRLDYGSDQVDSADFASVPGLMTLVYLPTPGISRDRTSPVNLAARSVYSYIRHANSGHSNYDSPDLMMYLLAMDSLYSYLNWAKRIYGYLSLYTQYNRYVPRALVESNGVDFDSLISDPAKFRTSLNLLLQSAGALVVPNTMGFMKKHLWMTSNCYLDDMSVKAQMYQFVPEGYWIYDEKNGAGQMRFMATWNKSPRMTLEDIISVGRSILDPLVGSEDINIMSGDILKAYGDAGVIRLTLVPEDFIVLPAYNAAALNIIQNATLIDGVIDHTKYLITQDATTGPNGGAILYDPIVIPSTGGTLCSVFTNNNRFLTFHKDDISPRDIITGTMGMVCTTGTGSSLKIRSCGSEVFRFAQITKFAQFNKVWSLSHTVTQGYVSELSDSTASYTSFLKYTADVNYFNDHPMQMAYKSVDIGGRKVAKVESINLDFDNYAIVAPTTLDNIHESTLMSMFNVPIMGLDK